MSMTPAFSPGPWITHGALVGNPRRCSLEDLYEQCSFHIAEKIPSSVKLGTRPISLRMRSYSSGLRPCDATSSGVIWGWFMGLLVRERSLIREIGGGGKGLLGGNFPLSIALQAALRHRSLHIGHGSDLRMATRNYKSGIAAHPSRRPLGVLLGMRTKPVEIPQPHAEERAMRAYRSTGPKR